MFFRTKRVIFTSILMFIFEYFLFKYIFLLFGGVNDLICLFIAFLFSFLNCIAPIFEEKKSRCITRFISTFCGIWYWASLMFLIDIIIIYIFGCFIELSFIVKICLLAIVPLLGIYEYYHAHDLKVHEKTIYLDKIKKDVNLVHFSDVHFGSVRYKKHILKIANKLKELDKICDLAIISGDLADGSCLILEDDFLPFKEVKMPIIFTPGNHDWYPGIENVIKACKKADIIVLDNDCCQFYGLNIFGYTFSFGNMKIISFNKLSQYINDEMVNIINFHIPNNWEEFRKIGFDIQLSGHTHGGQFHPVTTIGPLIYGYSKGLFKKNDKYLHVTTGVGSMDAPMRWGTDSELVILKLRKK